MLPLRTALVDAGSPLQPGGPRWPREWDPRGLDPCVGDGEVGVAAVGHRPVEAQRGEVAVLLQVDRRLHRQHDVPAVFSLISDYVVKIRSCLFFRIALLGIIF